MSDRQFRLPDVIANLATLVVCLCAVVIALPAVKNRPSATGNVKPNELADLRGLRVDSIAVRNALAQTAPGIQTMGKRTVLYQFATDCPYCTAQKSFIAGVLQEMQKDTSLLVLTVSDEPFEIIANYWNSDGHLLPSPYSMHPETTIKLAAFTVPRIYFLDEFGTINIAFEGSVLTLSSPQLIGQVPRLRESSQISTRQRQ